MINSIADNMIFSRGGEIIRASFEDFEIIHIEKDVIVIWDCIRTAKEIDFHINNNRHFIVLLFAENVSVSASFFGFLMERKMKLEKLQGELIIVTNNLEIQYLIRVLSIHPIIPTYNSLNDFMDVYPKTNKTYAYCIEN